MHDRLRAVALFSHLEDNDLDRLAAGAREFTLDTGETLFSEGDEGDEAFVICDGELEILKESVGRDVLLAVRHDGDVIGEMALLEEAPRMASARARKPTTVIAIAKGPLDELLDTSPTAARGMFDVLLARWRETEARLRQSERMAQLGTLTAGLAHELNNPASAVKRSAVELHEAVEAYAATHAVVGPATEEALRRALETIGDRDNRPQLDAIARSDAESELEEWMLGHGIGEPWDKTGPLTEAGIDGTDLDSLPGTPEQVAAMVDLLVAASSVHDLLYQVGEGSARVFEIVQALKSYSFLDRAPVQEVDLAKGIEDTVLILGSKLTDIEVERNLDGLPAIQAYGSELNQVWTNLIDNAADAIRESGGGKITISGRVSEPHIVITVEDDGPGIPEDVLPRVFDSFFTTKEPGKGTGLGLDITYGIVVNRHGGDITIDTEPGRTAFNVLLPIEGPPS